MGNIAEKNTRKHATKKPRKNASPAERSVEDIPTETDLADPAPAPNDPQPVTPETLEVATIPAVSLDEKNLIQDVWARTTTAKEPDRLVRAIAERAKGVGYSEEYVVNLVEELAAAVGDQQVKLRVSQVESAYKVRGRVNGGWSELRRFGLTPTNLPSLVSPAAEDDSAKERMVRFAVEETELLTDDRNEGHSNIDDEDGIRLMAVRSADFRSLLGKIDYDRTGKVPGTQAIRSAVNIIEAIARRGRRITPSNRVARGEDGAIWLDMADKAKRAIRVTAEGWEIIDRPPPLFRRYKHQLAFPIPVRGGDAWKVLKFVNIPNPNDQILYVTSLVAALVPGIPQAVMIFLGSQGSAKTTAARIRRQIIDPSATPTLITMSRRGELVLALDQHYMPILDNVTAIPGWYSDIICQAVTGASFTKRMLRTDTEEVLLAFRRPIIMTALTLPRTPADLPDRALILNFERIEPTKRLRERELWAEFEAELPAIFGGVLDLLVHAMACQGSLQLPELPRMADFAHWCAAVASAQEGGVERFLQALSDNSLQRDIDVTDDDLVGSAVKKFAEGLTRPWRGSPTELWNKLGALPNVNQRLREWPRRAADLSKRLTTLLSVLISQGVVVRSYKQHGNRFWEVSRRDQQEGQSAVHAATTAPDGNVTKNETEVSEGVSSTGGGTGGGTTPVESQIMGELQAEMDTGTAGAATSSVPPAQQAKTKRRNLIPGLKPRPEPPQATPTPKAEPKRKRLIPGLKPKQEPPKTPPSPPGKTGRKRLIPGLPKKAA
jgi:hypothetical protein